MAHAQILFEDQFNSTPQSSDVNTGIGAPRQTGSLVNPVSGVAYTIGGVTDGFREQVNNSGFGPGLLIASRQNDTLAVSPNLDFQTNNYSISFGLTLANIDNGFSFIDFGASTQNLFVNSASNGLGLLFEPNGDMSLFNNGTDVADFSDSNVGTSAFTVNIDVTGGQVAISVDGNRDATLTGYTPGSDNYISLAQYQNTGNVEPTYFTDLTVSNISEVPEPSTWAMMLGGLGILFVVVRRRSASV